MQAPGVMQAWLNAVGVLGPGLSGWVHTRALLSGSVPYVPAQTELPRLELLPPVERRRTGLPVKLALAVGQEAIVAAAMPANALRTVFASAGADGEVVHEICETLASPDRQVSPTRFHNSVHNAPAGYWSIATQSRAPSTSVCCYDWSFAAGLLEALTQVACAAAPVLLICCDAPYPEPLASARHVAAPFAVALLLAPAGNATRVAQLAVKLEPLPTQDTRVAQPALEQLRSGNASARSLPLLAALAGTSPTSLRLDYLGDAGLRVEVTPC